VVGPDVGADVAQGRGEVGHQRVLGVLAEDRGDRRRVERGELGGSPWPGLPEALGEAGGDGEVAAAAGPLADRRPPAGTEVDRVEADDEGGAGLAVALEQLGLGIGQGWLGRGQGGGVGRDPLLVDPHRARPSRHPSSGFSDALAYVLGFFDGHRLTVA
jgi:hypothetical protein